MINRINKNPIEISFYNWIKSNPESFHQLDLKRFYEFAFTALHNKDGQKYYKKDFFIKKCKSYGLTDQYVIDSYWNKLSIIDEMKDCIDYRLRKTAYILNESKDCVYEQVTVINNEKYIVNISKSEHKNGGISQQEVMNPDAILDCEKISYEEFQEINKKNNMDDYLKCTNVQQQNLLDLSDRLVDDPHYQEVINRYRHIPTNEDKLKRKQRIEYRKKREEHQFCFRRLAGAY